MNEPYNECPSFLRCSVSQCPLDESMLKRPAHRADREQKCHATRTTRLALVARHSECEFPTGGLTLAEQARDLRRAHAKARWDALSPEERAERTAKLRPFPRNSGIPES